MVYTGLPSDLKTVIYARDQHRCRWCGRTGIHVDIHHIRYRRGKADDVAENLICLCRQHHDFVHGTKNKQGDTIMKADAQAILNDLVVMPGVTGMALLRQRQRLQGQNVGDDGRPDRPADDSGRPAGDDASRQPEQAPI